MIEIKGDIWELASYNTICITTNNIVKKDGSLVMGKGIAKQCALLFPDIPQILGNVVAGLGNRPYNLGERTHKSVVYRIFSFPTKWHWRDKADIRLIKNSAELINQFVTLEPDDKIFLPRVGCGNGGLDWDEEVKPVLVEILDDRFMIVEEICTQ